MKEDSKGKRNLSFSQRKGLKPIRTQLQIDSMDTELRNAIWNILTEFFWRRIVSSFNSEASDVYNLIEYLWMNHFHFTKDTLSEDWMANKMLIREYYFKCHWNEVYDLLESIAEYYSIHNKLLFEKFIVDCNIILEKEMSAYRFLGSKITQITSEEEISEIEEALTIPNNLVKDHLSRALELLSDRKNPDYRNSIKESISAVEVISRKIVGNPKASLGDALSQIEKKGEIELHGALKSAFSSLYGYTSSAEGIRHALQDKTILYFEDAKLMLVLCSAFINYLQEKSHKVGIKLS